MQANHFLYCARCDTPLMRFSENNLCPHCGAVFQKVGKQYRFVADLLGTSIKELHRHLGES